MIYVRRRKDKIEKVEVDSIDEAKEEAIRNWINGSHLPYYIVDKNGKQTICHAKLRKFLLKQTGLGKWEEDRLKSKKPKI